MRLTNKELDLINHALDILQSDYYGAHNQDEIESEIEILKNKISNEDKKRQQAKILKDFDKVTRENLKAFREQNNK